MGVGIRAGHQCLLRCPRGSLYTHPAPGVTIDKLPSLFMDITSGAQDALVRQARQSDPGGQTGTKPDSGPLGAPPIVTPQPPQAGVPAELSLALWLITSCCINQMGGAS